MKVPKVGDTIEDPDGWTYTVRKVDADGDLVRATQDTDEPPVSFIFDLHELWLASDGYTWLGRHA